MNVETNRNSFDSWSRLANGWNDDHGAAFLVSTSHLDWNRSRQSLVRYETTDVCGAPVVFAFATKEGIEAGLASNTMWISLWGKIANGREVEFVHDLETLARLEGKSRLMFGADEFHLTSGIPMSSPGGSRLITAVTAAGFAGSEVADYVGELASEATSRYVEAAVALQRERGLRFTKADSAIELDRVEAFIAKEFPGRWAREIQFWRRRGDTGRAFWMSLSDETGMIGFARMAVRGRVRPFDQGWTPGALRTSFSGTTKSVPEADDSCLGPIGVAASQRGRGTGKALLGLVLKTLRENDARRVCIDWTNAFKYYEPLEYARVRRIWTAWKDGL